MNALLNVTEVKIAGHLLLWHFTGERGAECVEAGIQQLLQLCLYYPATNMLVLYSNSILVKIYSVLQLCKYVWITVITGFYITSQC